MNTERLFSVLSAIHPISQEFRQSVSKVLTPLSLPKYHVLLEAPKVAEHAYFLHEGFAMSYMFINGEKQVECLWHSGHIVLSAKSFFEHVPSTEFIQLRNDSEVLCISQAAVLDLFQKFPEALAIHRVLMNRYYEDSRERLRDMQHLSALQRYDKLIRKFPTVERYVTQEDIASYLGITPQSLSRVKRQKRWS